MSAYAGLVWVVFGLAALCRCDELGNPIRAGTQATKWSDGDISVSTDSRSFSAAEASKLLPRLSGQLHHLDPTPDKILTLVEVSRSESRRPLPRVVPLVTEFELPDRNRVLRRWSAPAEASSWRAAFYLDSAPRSATTALAW